MKAVRYSLRLPPALHQLALAALRMRQEQIPGYSLNDLICEATRSHVQATLQAPPGK